MGIDIIDVTHIIYPIYNSSMAKNTHSVQELTVNPDSLPSSPIQMSCSFKVNHGKAT